MFTDERVRETFGYITARPGDFFSARWDAIWGAYTALFRGSVYNTRVDDFATAIRPLTETCKFAAPLIAAGLGVGLAFRAALFNIGGRGQMLLAGAAAGWVGYQFELALADPPGGGDRGRHGGRRALGRTGRLPQGPHRRPRGDRHDHAQLRRLLPGVLRPVRAEPAAGARLGQPEVAAHAGVGGRCPSCWATATTCTSASCWPWSQWPSSGGSSTGRPWASASVRSARTPPRRAPPASTSAAPTPW